MEEKKRSSEKLIELIRSQPNPEEFAEMLLRILENSDEKQCRSNRN